jgi:hypothetical protein
LVPVFKIKCLLVLAVNQILASEASIPLDKTNKKGSNEKVAQLIEDEAGSSYFDNERC